MPGLLDTNNIGTKVIYPRFWQFLQVFMIVKMVLVVLIDKSETGFAIEIKSFLFYYFTMVAPDGGCLIAEQNLWS